MFTHKKKPLFPVRVDNPDPKFAQKLLEQFGGRSGELTAMLEYFVQSVSCDEAKVRDLLLDVATEEIGHLEMVGLMIDQLTRGAEREKAYEDSLFSVMGKGPHLLDSLGNAWTADWVRASGDVVADLKHNISAEAGAKMAYERLIHATDDAGCKETLTYLMAREISHQRMFAAALESLGKEIEGELKPEVELDTYYDLSRGDGDGQDVGLGTQGRGPWNEPGAWNVIEEPETVLRSAVHGPANGRS